MACERYTSTGTCGHHQCQFTDQTEHGYRCVEVNSGLGLCEVGENCVPECEFSYKSGDVKPCPTCKGNPVTDQKLQCPTCFVFGIVRVEDLIHAQK